MIQEEQEEGSVRIRVRFTKTGPLKFIGHLDVMRYFQKAVRRADIPAALSEGFSPHMIMSFAQPLGVGKTSGGEDFDLDLKDGASFDRDDFVDRLNRQMSPGIEVLNAAEVPADKKNKGMALVAAASYMICFRKGQTDFANETDSISRLSEKIHAYLAQEQIPVLRKTKKSEEETDIRPWIFDMEACLADEKMQNGDIWNVEADPVGFRILVSARSGSNLKPELLIMNFASYAGLSVPEASLLIHRINLYGRQPKAEEDGDLVPLDEIRVVRTDSSVPSSDS